MKKQAPNLFPVIITFTTLMVLLACSMPLGEILVSPSGVESQGDGSKILIFQTWNSHLIIQPLKIPNWLLIVPAIIILACTWLAANGVWKGTVWIPLVCATYGLAHGFGMTYVMVKTPNATVGFGSLIVTTGFLVMLYTISRHALIQKKLNP